jgi:hypothetical protein
MYARSANVTALIVGPGTYRVGRVPASLNGADDVAGWTLFVVFRAPLLPSRNITLFQVFLCTFLSNIVCQSV